MEHPLCWWSESWMSWWCLHNTCGSGKCQNHLGKWCWDFRNFETSKMSTSMHHDASNMHQICIKYASNMHQTEKLCNLCYRKYEFGTLRRWLESVPAPKSQHVTVRLKKNIKMPSDLFSIYLGLKKLAIPPSILAIDLIIFHGDEE